MYAAAHHVLTTARRLGLSHTAQLATENLLSSTLGDGARQRLHRGLNARSHAAFDRRNGTDTALPPGNPDEPTDERSFANILRLLEIDRGRYDWIDIGCGKGRTVVLAARAGFRRVFGVDLNESYVAAAAANLEIAAPGLQQRVELSAGDIRHWSLPPTDQVLFCFNPFGPDILRAVLERVADPAPGHRIFVYYNAVHRQAAEAFINSGRLRRRIDTQLLYNDCLILETPAGD